MGWKEFLEKLSLAKIKGNLKIEQGGLINVKLEQHNYYFQLPDAEKVKQVKEAAITPELEEKIKKEVEKILAPLGVPLNAIPETSMKEIVLSTSVATATEVIGTVKAVLSPITVSGKGTVGPPQNVRSERPKK